MNPLPCEPLPLGCLNRARRGHQHGSQARKHPQFDVPIPKEVRRGEQERSSFDGIPSHHRRGGLSTRAAIQPRPAASSWRNGFIQGLKSRAVVAASFLNEIHETAAVDAMAIPASTTRPFRQILRQHRRGRQTKLAAKSRSTTIRPKRRTAHRLEIRIAAAAGRPEPRQSPRQLVPSSSTRRVAPARTNGGRVDRSSRRSPCRTTCHSRRVEMAWIAANCQPPSVVAAPIHRPTAFKAAANHNKT